MIDSQLRSGTWWLQSNGNGVRFADLTPDLTSELMIINTNKVFAIVNDGWKSDAFIHQMSKHLGGDMHVIGEPHDAAGGGTVQVVGFGGETWRGNLVRSADGAVLKIFLIPNFECSPDRVALITIGLAELTHNRWE
jgi:hypothetical protein